VTQLRIRRSVAAASSATLPVLVGLFLALEIRPLWAGILVGLALAVVATSVTTRRVRRRTLTVHDDVLVVQRDAYRLVVPWQGVTGVQRRKHQLVMDVEELLCTGASVEAVDSRGRVSRLPRGLSEHPALSRVMVSLFDKDWREGPIGQKVRDVGVDV
jgi:hypothetical protein